MPEALDLILTPFITLTVMITLGLFAIGPVFHSLEEWVLHGTTAVLDLPFGIAGIIIGFFNQIIVVTGVHHIFNFLEIQLLEKTGYNPFNAIVTSAMAAQGAACLAVGLKQRIQNSRHWRCRRPYPLFSGLANLPFWGKPALHETVHYGTDWWRSWWFSRILVPSEGYRHGRNGDSRYIAVSEQSAALYILVNVVAVGVAFALTWFFGYKDEPLAVEETTKSGNESDASADQTAGMDDRINQTAVHRPKVELLEIASPMTGTAVALANVPDPAFSEKHMGEGLPLSLRRVRCSRLLMAS